MLNNTTKQIKRDYRNLRRKKNEKQDLFKILKFQLKRI